MEIENYSKLTLVNIAGAGEPNACLLILNIWFKPSVISEVRYSCVTLQACKKFGYKTLCYLQWEETSVVCSVLYWFSFLFRAEGHKNQESGHWYWTLYEVQIHDSPALCQRSFWTNSLLCTTTRHMYCFQVWDYATITASTGEGCHWPN